MVTKTARALGAGFTALFICQSATHIAQGAPDPNPPFAVSGADTLSGFTNHVLDACEIESTTLQYEGGGSSLGARKMLRGDQQIAPMSRLLSDAQLSAGTSGGIPNECDAVAPNAGQGCLVALDAVSILADSSEDNACDTLRFSGTIEVLDENGFAGIDDGAGGACSECGDGPDVDGVLDHYAFNDWRDILRIVYASQHAHVALDECSAAAPARSDLGSRFCNSDVRNTLVNHWGTLFEEGASCGASDPDACIRLHHAFRSDDVSGTTDLFLQLLGLPATVALANGSGGGITAQRAFCNGSELEDNDPIRRTCIGTGYSDGVQVCQAVDISHRGVLTSSGWAAGPSINPPDDDSADLGLVLPIVMPTADPYPTTPTGSCSVNFAAVRSVSYPCPLRRVRPHAVRTA